MGNGNGLPNILARVAKISDRKQLKILTPIQMVQRLPIALTQVKAGNTYESLLNEIRHTFFVCSIVNYFKSDGWISRMDTIFMNYKNSKVYDFHK